MPIDADAAREELLKRWDDKRPDFIGQNVNEQKAVDCWSDFFAALTNTFTPLLENPDGPGDAFRASATGMSVGFPVFLAAANAVVGHIATGMKTVPGFLDWKPALIPYFDGLNFSSPALLRPDTTPFQAADYIASSCAARLRTGKSTREQIGTGVIVVKDWT